jgi:hypothetical protein
VVIRILVTWSNNKQEILKVNTKNKRMNYSYRGFVLLALSVAISCNKGKADLATYSATINVVNAIASYDAEIKMNLTGGEIIYAGAKNLDYYYYDGKYSNGALTFGLPSGVTYPLQVALSKDTTTFIFNQAIAFQEGDIYSLFLTGYSDEPTWLLTKDILPQHADSTTGVRFINLSPNSTAVSVNIAGNIDGNEADDLLFNTSTEFIALPAKKEVDSYLFEIRDANSGDKLTEFYYDNIARLKNVTLVIRGSVNGDPGLEVVRINNY